MPVFISWSIWQRTQKCTHTKNLIKNFASRRPLISFCASFSQRKACTRRIDCSIKIQWHDIVLSSRWWPARFLHSTVCLRWSCLERNILPNIWFGSDGLVQIHLYNRYLHFIVAIHARNANKLKSILYQANTLPKKKSESFIALFQMRLKTDVQFIWIDANCIFHSLFIEDFQFFEKLLFVTEPHSCTIVTKVNIHCEWINFFVKCPNVLVRWWKRSSLMRLLLRFYPIWAILKLSVTTLLCVISKTLDIATIWSVSQRFKRFIVIHRKLFAVFNDKIYCMVIAWTLTITSERFGKIKRYFTQRW